MKTLRALSRLDDVIATKAASWIEKLATRLDPAPRLPPWAFAYPYGPKGVIIYARSNPFSLTSEFLILATSVGSEIEVLRPIESRQLAGLASELLSYWSRHGSLAGYLETSEL